MFSSFFGSPSIHRTAQNFFSVTTELQSSDAFGPLVPGDTEWICSGATTIEMQAFYSFAEDGTTILVQVSRATTGPWPMVEMGIRVYNPNTKETTRRTVKVTNFVAPAPGLDQRSCRSDQVTITHQLFHDSDFPEGYSVHVNGGDDLQISFQVKRPAAIPGFKVGKGSKGGCSYFGPDCMKPTGYISNRVWPRYLVTGHLVQNGRATELKGSGLFTHVNMCMAELLFSRMDFSHFQRNEYGGVSAFQAEFTTSDGYGKNGAGSGGVKVNFGSLVIGGQLAAVTAETVWPGEPEETHGMISRAHRLNQILDTESGYRIPSETVFQWRGPSIIPGIEGDLDAALSIDFGSPNAPKGLIERIDVLEVLPKFVRTIVVFIARSSKPYVYQWMHTAKLVIKGPDSIIPGLAGGLEIEGHMYTSASLAQNVVRQHPAGDVTQSAGWIETKAVY